MFVFVIVVKCKFWILAEPSSPADLFKRKGKNVGVSHAALLQWLLVEHHKTIRSIFERLKEGDL